MKKIRLDVEALGVQSFATVDAPERGRGTVRGAQVLDPWSRETEYASCRACETGSCLGTRYDPGCTDAGVCPTGTDCELQPWTEGQDTCIC